MFSASRAARAARLSMFLPGRAAAGCAQSHVPSHVPSQTQSHTCSSMGLRKQRMSTQAQTQSQQQQQATAAAAAASATAFMRVVESVPDLRAAYLDIQAYLVQAGHASLITHPPPLPPSRRPSGSDQPLPEPLPVLDFVATQAISVTDTALRAKLVAMLDLLQAYGVMPHDTKTTQGKIASTRPPKTFAMPAARAVDGPVRVVGISMPSHHAQARSRRTAASAGEMSESEKKALEAETARAPGSQGSILKTSWELVVKAFRS
ncbi:hypothetical protein BC831DRAFT_468807 [Entophlyctis helioformis]|nr:hypothetical protein BC831DRAFT_468807 [Entophlyctis helioformis]